MNDKEGKTIEDKPREYRLCQRLLENGYIIQTVLQGLFYWTDNNGNAGADWIDIPTVAEVME